MLACDKEMKSDDTLKVLGISWVPAQDTYKFTFNPESVRAWSKHSVLSVIARMFDPLGLLAPVVIRAKKFMQSLRLKDLDWDKTLPESFNAH